MRSLVTGVKREEIVREGYLKGKHFVVSGRSLPALGKQVSAVRGGETPIVSVKCPDETKRGVWILGQC